MADIGLSQLWCMVESYSPDWEMRCSLHPLGFLSMLIQGAVLAYLYPQVVDVQGSVFEGIGFCLLIGLFLASSAVIAEAAKQRVASLRLWFVVESLYYLIQFLLVGLAMSSIYSTL